MILRTLRAGWFRFFFAPQPTSTLAMVRVGFAALVVLWALALGPDLTSFFGGSGLLPSPPTTGILRPSLLEHIHSNVAIYVVWAVLLAAALSLLVGWHSRISALVVLAGVVTLQLRNPFVLHTGDVLLRVMLVYLALSQSGAALSLDARRRGANWDFEPVAAWPIRLMQLQICLMYLFTGISKLMASQWISGDAVGWALRDDLSRFGLPDLALRQLWLIHAFSWGTIAFELSFPFLIWNRRLRWWLLAAGLVLHLGIDVTLEVGLFSLTVLVSYLVFIPPDTAANLLRRFRREASPREAPA